MKESFFELIMLLMKRMNKMLLVAALAATTLSVQAEQKKGPAWLSDALFYQIYPSSYMDTDGNGIGDLPVPVHCQYCTGSVSRPDNSH